MQIVVLPLPLCQFFSTQTVVYSLSFLMGHNCRSFTPIVGCGQASSLNERVSPPSFSNHSSVDMSLDYPPSLFCMFHRHFMFNMSLKSFPPCWVPSIQAYKSDTWELTTLLLQTICRPSSHPPVFLQTVSLLCYFCLKPISSCLEADIHRLPSRASDLTALHFTLPWLPRLLGQRHKFSSRVIRSVMGWSLTTIQSRLHRTAVIGLRSAAPSARYTPSAFPHLLPSSLPHSLHFSTQRSPQGSHPLNT